MRRPLVASLVVFVVLLACHRQPDDVALRNARSNVITEEEIDSVNAASVYDLIVKLHAEYLRDRGKTSIGINPRGQAAAPAQMNQHERAVVFMNDQEYGIPETLRNLQPGRFSEIRYFDGVDAVGKFGSQYGGGVIQLISRNQ